MTQELINIIAKTIHEELSRQAILEYLDNPFDATKIAESVIASIKTEQPIDDIVARAKIEATKASKKFPQPTYITLKIAEEAGEVIRGCIHYGEKRMEWTEVEQEIVQLIAMIIRLLEEGDQINNIIPPYKEK
jgi:NTP pyrophosphatase (non-canonical NTP hydrolase)